MQQIRIRIGEILLHKHLTKAELARRVAASQPLVNQVCNGTARPSKPLAAKIADELGRDPRELFQEWEPGLFEPYSGGAS
jgi:transcriptional regulator with XRE-family HTH domain